MTKEAVRGIYDGSLFYKIAEENERGKGRKKGAEGKSTLESVQEAMNPETIKAKSQ